MKNLRGGLGLDRLRTEIGGIAELSTSLPQENLPAAYLVVLE
jgi:hypothetical protein